MACPFFLPTERIASDLWPHRARLPLGDGFGGLCTAPGHDGTVLSHEELKSFCNLGYARLCPRLPQERHADAVRFIVTHDHDQVISLYFTTELHHAPGEHGSLAFDCKQRAWIKSHSDARIQRMAECYLASYVSRKNVRNDRGQVISISPSNTP